MWAAIVAMFPVVAGWINLVVGWFQARAAAQTAADSAETTAMTQHQNDGAQSVSDKDSSDAQNAALDQLEKQIDNPIPIVITKPGGQ